MTGRVSASPGRAVMPTTSRSRTTTERRLMASRPTLLEPVPPGEILMEEFMDEGSRAVSADLPLAGQQNACYQTPPGQTLARAVLLLRRGLPSTVPRQEPERLLRPRGNGPEPPCGTRGWWIEDAPGEREPARARSARHASLAPRRVCSLAPRLFPPVSRLWPSPKAAQISPTCCRISAENPAVVVFVAESAILRELTQAS